jgi:hypothetical protein
VKPTLPRGRQRYLAILFCLRRWHFLLYLLDCLLPARLAHGLHTEIVSTRGTRLENPDGVSVAGKYSTCIQTLFLSDSVIAKYTGIFTILASRYVQLSCL